MSEPNNPSKQQLDPRHTGSASMVEIDSHGDLVLIVGEGKLQKRFLVCSRTLARASRPFDTMLYGPFKESKPSNPSKHWTVHTPDDHTEAFEIILNIIHLKSDSIPSDVNCHILFEVLVLGDKYLMGHILRSIASGWYELQFNWHSYDYSDDLEPREHLSVARWLGEEETVWCGLIRYAYHTRLADETEDDELPELVYQHETFNENSGRERTYSNPLADELKHLPKIYLDAIRSIRIDVLEDNIHWLGKAIRRGAFATTTTRYDHAWGCKSMDVDALEKCDKPDNASDWRYTVHKFLNSLRAAVNECKSAHRDEWGNHHESCNVIDEDFIYPYWSWRENHSDWQISQSSVGPALVQAITKDLNNFKRRDWIFSDVAS